jgi:hypothetical protein
MMCQCDGREHQASGDDTQQAARHGNPVARS